jgi:hypothetical protein
MDIEVMNPRNRPVPTTAKLLRTLDYVENVDIGWVQSPMTNQARQIPQINGFNIHKLKGTSKLSEGAYLALDGRPEYAPITTYVRTQRDFSADSQFPIINIYQYSEKPGSYNEQVVTEFIAETFSAPKAPNSVCLPKLWSV